MFRGHEARENRDAAGKDHIIMVTTAIGGAADFLHGQPASRCAVFGRQLFQNQNAVRETENMTVGAGCAAVVQEQGGAITSREILFEGKNLASIAERILRKQTK